MNLFWLMDNSERKLLLFAIIRSILSIFLEILALIIFVILSSHLISINGGAELDGLRARILNLVSFHSTDKSLTTGILVSEITIIYLVKNLLGYLNVVYLNRIIARVQNRIAENLYLRFFKLPFKSLNSISTAEASASLVDSINHAVAGRISFLVLGFVELLNIFTILVVLSIQNILITITLVLFCASMLLFTYKRLRSRASNNGKQLYKSTIASRLYFSQGKDSISIFSLSGRIPFFLDNLNQERRSFTDAYLKSINLQQLPKYLIESYLLLTLFFLYIFSQILPSKGSSSQFLLLFFLAGIRILPSITRLQSLWLGLADSKHRVDSFFKVFDQISAEQSELNSPNSHKLPMPTNITIEKIVGKDLFFSYENELIIENLNFEITGQSSTLIRGKSGSGKTTLLNLIAGLLNPTSGSVKYYLSDGSIHEAVAVQYAIGYVPQYPVIFKGSLARNVILQEELDEYEYSRLSEVMSVVDDSDIFPKANWLKDSIPAGGSNLSGGERQRLNIARGIALQSNILIMDEPTNSLDSISASHIILGVSDYVVRRKGILISTTHQSEFHTFFQNVIDL